MVANALVKNFTVAGGEAGVLQLVVENISAVDDYAQVLKYLSARSFVQSLSVAQLSGDELTLQVSTTSSAKKFMQLLAIDSKLVASDRRVQARSLPALDARMPTAGEDGEDGEFGSRSAISVPTIPDELLRVAWRG